MPPHSLPPAPTSLPLTENDWAALIGEGLGQTVEVRFTRARQTVVTFQPLRGRRPAGAAEARVRLQHFFAEAPLEIREATVVWLRSGRRARRATRVLDDWIEARLAALWRDEPTRARFVTRGRTHDLEPLAHQLRATEFRDELEDGTRPRITWGRAGKSRSRHSLRLGSYDYLSGIVRVHTVLDQPAVPEWFVRYILFHELLHAVMPTEPSAGGRRLVHGPLFRKREDEYADTARARVWEKQNLSELIRSARTGRPLPLPGRKAAHVARLRRLGGWVQRELF